jgi:hypothetical protein
LNHPLISAARALLRAGAANGGHLPQLNFPVRSGFEMRFLILLLAMAAAVSAEVQRIDPPALPGSGMPFLATGPDGGVFLTWTEPLAGAEASPGGPEARQPAPKHHALRLSRWRGNAWTAPETIAQGANWFVNWADFPSLTVLPGGTMFAHWLTRADGAGTYGYGIRIARRDPVAAKWQPVHGLNLDDKEDYAGFLSFVPGESSAVYLAPPAARHAHQPDSGSAGHSHRKTLRLLTFAGSGTAGSSMPGANAADSELDPDVCSCCQTTIGKTESGYILAYRDHLPGEIRDISVIRFSDGVWMSPRTLHPDGWKINGCPTDGPSLSARGRQVAIAWLTRAGGQAKVQVALSSDEGRTFRAPLRADGGNPLGRPAVTPFDRNSELLVWLEQAADGVEIRIRRISHDGTLHPAVTIAQAPPGRAAGFPKAAVAANQILLSWRDQTVRAALLPQTKLLELEKEFAKK